MKVLIIKTGYSETLDPEISQSASLGDVVRSTVVLHPFKDDDITWLVDNAAYPLIKDNPYIDRVLIWGLDTALQLLFEEFDIVINLEKSPGLCALASKVNAWQRYGFRFNASNGSAEPYRETIDAWQTYSDYDRKRIAGRPWQEVLFEMLGLKWNHESYILGMKPKTDETPWKVGLNYQIGSKWPNKGWTHGNWDSLYSLLLKNGYAPSWQEGDRNLSDYINWINSCQVLVTNDSLGLHIAIALGKKIIALFGPTCSDEVDLYGLGKKIIAPNNCGFLPCALPSCKHEPCMAKITVDRVFKEIEAICAT